MSKEIPGSINEIRRTFLGMNGEKGTVEFGRTSKGVPNVGPSTRAKITLQNGKRYWTVYTSPKRVIIRKYK